MSRRLIVDGEQLTAAFARGRHCVGRFGGYHLETTPGWLHVVSTDGHRLVVSKMRAEGADATGPVTTGELISARGGLSFSGPTPVEPGEELRLDGERPEVEPQGFPDWHSLSRKKSPVRLVVSREELKKVAGGYSKGLALKMTVGRTLTLEPHDGSKPPQTVSAHTSGGERVLGVSSTYLRDAANAMDIDKVEIGVSEPLEPLVFVGKLVMVLLMPVRLEDLA